MCFIINELMLILLVKAHLKNKENYLLCFVSFLLVYSTKTYFTCPYMQYNIMRSSAEYNCIYY